VGSGDELAKGNSTFMVEMIETANILNSATDSSLVVLDEIGRGTSTYDGMSLAWATIEHLIDKIKCKTLFATHYNELCQLDQKYNQLELNTFRVKEWEKDLIFLHQLVPGVAKSSYGIQVAKMAGVPKEVIASAYKMLAKLEKNNNNANQKSQTQTSIKFEENKINYLFKNIVDDVNKINLNQMTPLEAINFLKEIQEKLKTQN
jgi:DNA mismatch repair protein MutS